MENEGFKERHDAIDELQNSSAVWDIPVKREQPVDKAVRLLRAKLFMNDSTNVDKAEVRLVWFNYTLGGWKAMLITTLPDDHYYEVTYNKEKCETYIDAYKKFANTVIPD